MIGGCLKRPPFCLPGNFKKIFREIYSYENLFLIVAHLIWGTQKLVNKTHYVMMDIKASNLLFSVYNKEYLHPVFIDFSPDYMVGKYLTFKKYVHSFRKTNPNYRTWPPEVRILMAREKDPSISGIDLIFEQQKNMLNDFKKDYNFSTEIANIDVFKYFYQNEVNVNHIVNDIKESVLVVTKELSKKFMTKSIAEKIMLWEIGNFILFLIPDELIRFSSKNKNEKDRTIISMVEGLQ